MIPAAAALFGFWLSAAPAQAPPPAVSARQLFEAAAASLQRGDLAQAETGFLRVLKAQPGHIGALGNLGVTYSRLERFEDAARTYRRALAIAPHDPGLLVNLGLALLKQDRFTEALRPLEAAVTQHPAGAQPRELLATAQLHLGRAEEAAQTLAPLAATPGVLFLRGLAHLKLNQREEAMRAFAALESSLPPRQTLFLRGKAFYESGFFDEAARELAQCAEAVLDCRRELAKVHVSQRRAEEAEAGFRAVLAAKAGDREASYFLGALLIEADRMDEGVALLKGPGASFWAANYYLGKAALKQQRIAEAIRYFRLAGRERPEDPNLLYQLLRAQQAAGDRAAASQTAARLRVAQAKQREGEQSALVLR